MPDFWIFRQESTYFKQEKNVNKAWINMINEMDFFA